MEGDDIWGDSSGGGEESKEESKTDTDAAGAAEPEPDPEDDETRSMSNGELRQRIHLLSNDIRVMKSNVQRITHESRGQRDRIRENQEKVKINKQLPYLVANVVEILEPDAEDGLEEEEKESGDALDADANRKTRSAVVRTSTRQTIFLPISGSC